MVIIYPLMIHVGFPTTQKDEILVIGSSVRMMGMMLTEISGDE